MINDLKISWKKNAMLNLSINGISGHSLPLFLFPLSSLIFQILCFDFNWRIIASQYCGSLCHTLRQISHKYIYIYIYIYISSPLILSLHPSPLGRHRGPGWAPRVIKQLPDRYLFYTYMVVCISQGYILNPSYSFLLTLSPSPFSASVWFPKL